MDSHEVRDLFVKSPDPTKQFELVLTKDGNIVAQQKGKISHHLIQQLEQGLATTDLARIQEVFNQVESFGDNRQNIYYQAVKRFLSIKNEQNPSAAKVNRQVLSIKSPESPTEDVEVGDADLPQSPRGPMGSSEPFFHDISDQNLLTIDQIKHDLLAMKSDLSIIEKEQRELGVDEIIDLTRAKNVRDEVNEIVDNLDRLQFIETDGERLNELNKLFGSKKGEKGFEDDSISMGTLMERIRLFAKTYEISKQKSSASNKKPLIDFFNCFNKGDACLSGKIESLSKFSASINEAVGIDIDNEPDPDRMLFIPGFQFSEVLDELFEDDKSGITPNSSKSDIANSLKKQLRAHKKEFIEGMKAHLGPIKDISRDLGVSGDPKASFLEYLERRGLFNSRLSSPDWSSIADGLIENEANFREILGKAMIYNITIMNAQKNKSVSPKSKSSSDSEPASPREEVPVGSVDVGLIDIEALREHKMRVVETKQREFIPTKLSRKEDFVMASQRAISMGDIGLALDIMEGYKDRTKGKTLSEKSLSQGFDIQDDEWLMGKWKGVISIEEYSTTMMEEGINFDEIAGTLTDKVALVIFDQTTKTLHAFRSNEGSIEKLNRSTKAWEKANKDEYDQLNANPQNIYIKLGKPIPAEIMEYYHADITPGSERSEGGYFYQEKQDATVSSLCAVHAAHAFFGRPVIDVLDYYNFIKEAGLQHFGLKRDVLYDRTMSVLDVRKGADPVFLLNYIKHMASVGQVDGRYQSMSHHSVKDNDVWNDAEINGISPKVDRIIIGFGSSHFATLRRDEVGKWHLVDSMAENSQDTAYDTISDAIKNCPRSETSSISFMY